MQEPKKEQPRKSSFPYAKENIQVPANLLAGGLTALGLTHSSTIDPDPVATLKNPAQALGKRVEAIQTLAEWGRHAPVDVLEYYLDQKNEDEPAIRAAVVRALGKLDNTHAKTIQPENFEYALHDNSPEVQLAAIQVFEDQPQSLDDSLVISLIEKFQDRRKQDSKSKLVRVAIVHLLGTLKERVPVRVLLDAREDKDWQVREMAFLSLGDLDERVSSDELVPALYDDNLTVRQAGITVFEKRSPDFVFNRMVADLKNANKLVSEREKAAWMLGYLGNKAAIEPLNEVLERLRDTHSSTIRPTIILALSQLNTELKIPSALRNYVRQDPTLAEVINEPPDTEELTRQQIN